MLRIVQKTVGYVYRRMRGREGITRGGAIPRAYLDSTQNFLQESTTACNLDEFHHKEARRSSCTLLGTRKRIDLITSSKKKARCRYESQRERERET